MTAEPVIQLEPPLLAAATLIAPRTLRLDRADRLAFLFAALPALAVYLGSLSSEVTLQDSGIDCTAAYYGSGGFPPGFPAWSLYSWFFTKLLPFSNIAWRVSVGSAVAGALMCGFIAILISFAANTIFKDTPLFRRLTVKQWGQLRIVSGTAAALVLGFTNMVWSQAVIAETLSFNWMLFAGSLWFLTRAAFSPPGRINLWLAFLLFGLTLTGSQELVIALPGFACLLMVFNLRLGRDLSFFVLPLTAIMAAVFSWGTLTWMHGGSLNWPLLGSLASMFMTGVVAAVATRGLGGEWKSTLVATLGLLMGLAFYLYLPLVSMTTPPMNWGYPRTLEGFLHTVSRGQYETLHPTNSLDQFAKQLWHAAEATSEDFSWFYIAIALGGFVSLLFAGNRGRRWLAGLAAVWFCTGPMILAELNPGFDRQQMEIISIFFPPSWIVLTVLMGMGLITIGAWAVRLGREPEPVAPPVKCASS